ncbi:MAG TPA: hypothetical protein VGI58_01195 [Streptosporangiaceae bacterium]|jgi:hypothetical protein
MRTKVVAVAAIRLVRRAIGSLSPVALVAVVLALIFGGVGAASAATGRVFILGRANTETTTAKLSDSRGTPLSLAAPRGRAPLTVNRTAQVKNLNVQYVGGLSEASARPTGGAGSQSNLTIGPDSSLTVAATGPLSAGTYYVTATADINTNASGATGALCHLIANDDAADPLQFGGGSGQQVTAAETMAVTVRSHGVVNVVCSPTGTGGIEVVSASIIAIRVLSSSGTAAAVPGS